MPIDLRKYEDLKRKTEELKREADRAEGAYNEKMERLESEFGCKTIPKAKALLTDMIGKEKKAERSFNEALETFEADWGEKLK